MREKVERAFSRFFISLAQREMLRLCLIVNSTFLQLRKNNFVTAKKKLKQTD